MVPVGELDAEKIAESVLIYVSTIAFLASLLLIILKVGKGGKKLQWAAMLFLSEIYHFSPKGTKR